MIMIECTFSPMELDVIQTALEQAASRTGQECFLTALEAVRYQRAYGRIIKEPGAAGTAQGYKLELGKDSAYILHG